MKWYNFETRFLSLKNALMQFLRDSNIEFETSGAYSYYHFEILTDAAGAQKISAWLDENTITCQ